MIITQNLCKRYGKVNAVNNLNLNIRSGTIFGIVGENGAGKTTTLSMLATLVTPSSGKALVNGFELRREAKKVRRSIGYMPDAFGVYDELTAYEYLQFYAECYGVQKRVWRTRADELLESVDLIDKRRFYVNSLSRGMQQRLEIARCLMHDPAVLILDEPSSGLDPRSRIEMRSVLSRLRASGKTVVISSHILQELAEVADEIGIIRGGEVAAVAAINVMMSHTSAHRTLWLAGQAEWSKWTAVLQSDPHILEFSPRADGVEVVYAGTLHQQAELMERIIAQGITLYQFAERPTDIEALFLRLTERTVRS